MIIDLLLINHRRNFFDLRSFSRAANVLTGFFSFFRLLPAAELDSAGSACI